MQLPAWRTFSGLKKVLIVLTGIISLIAISFGWMWSQDIQVVIPSTKVSYSCTAGKSALNMLLINHAAELEHSSLGALVINIDGIAQNGGKYWQYQVDDKEATIGAQAYICRGNEKISWELK